MRDFDRSERWIMVSEIAAGVVLIAICSALIYSVAVIAAS